MKICVKCNSTLFYKSGDCIECARRMSIAYIEKNKEILSEKRKNYYQQNKEKLIEKSKLWKSNNKEKVKAISKAYYSASSETQKEKALKWQKDNPERTRARKAKWKKENRAVATSNTALYRARKINATPEWSIQFFIDEAYDLSFRRKKTTGLDWHVDHIVPLRGKNVCGLHAHTNIRVILGIDNVKKGNKLIDSVVNI